MTLILAVLGLRTFAKWKHEKIEERKILLAEEALRLAYLARSAFSYIREPNHHEHEDTELEISDRGKSRYVPIPVERHLNARVNKYADYFNDLEVMNLKLCPYFSGREDFFADINRARREVLRAWELLDQGTDKELAEMGEDPTSLKRTALRSYAPNRPPDPVEALIEKNITEVRELMMPVLTVK